MKVLLCVDDNNGMLFNHRRVSSDRAVTEKVNEIADGRLFITEFSRKLFPDARIIEEEGVRELGQVDYFFLENVSLASIVDMVSELIVFRWNRRYPSDFCLDIVPEETYIMVSTEDFVGNSHDRITMEVWRYED